MFRKIFLILAVVLMYSSIVLAQDNVQPSAQKQAPAGVANQQQKAALITNINAMRAQEARVAVLQQLLSEELAKLRNLQEVFCSQYKLDIDKLRKGLYHYDNTQGKFVEAAVSGTQAVTTSK